MRHKGRAGCRALFSLHPVVIQNALALTARDDKVLAQGASALRKDAKMPSLAGSARAITLLISEVRP
ncbi:hypothetical protein ABIB18_003286 [Pantoea sp. UYEF8]